MGQLRKKLSASQRLKGLRNHDDQSVRGTMAYYNSPNLQLHLILLLQLLARPGLISAYNTPRLSILRAGKSTGLPTSNGVKGEVVRGLYHHCIIIIIEFVSKLLPTTYAYIRVHDWLHAPLSPHPRKGEDFNPWW